MAVKKKAEEEKKKEEKVGGIKITRSAIANSDVDIFSLSSELVDKANRADGFKTMAEVANSYLPIPWLAMQYVIGRTGLPVNTIIEFIGEEGVGKSSLMHALMGCFMSHNVPCLYINSEPKMLEPDWRKRLYSQDPEMVEKIDRAALYDFCSTLDEMDIKIREWVTKCRGVLKLDREKIPLVVFVDSVTKLLNPDEAEAAGWSGDDKDAAKKGVQAISKKPGVTAKWMHAWCRAIAPLLIKANLTIILVSGQNQEMDAVASPFVSKVSLAKANKTRPGGNAVNQSAGIQFNLTRVGNHQNSQKEVCGKRICLSVQKNAFGPGKREIDYILLDDRPANYRGRDIEGKYNAPAILMDEALCNLLVEGNILAMTVDRRRYSSEPVGLWKVKADEMIDEIQKKPEMLLHVAKELGIRGYEEKL